MVISAIFVLMNWSEATNETNNKIRSTRCLAFWCPNHSNARAKLTYGNLACLYIWCSDTNIFGEAMKKREVHITDLVEEIALVLQETGTDFVEFIAMKVLAIENCRYKEDGWFEITEDEG